MDEMKATLGDAYLQPQRPLGMGLTLMKVTCKCALLLLRGSLGRAVGPARYLVETKGGCDLVHWALHMTLESNGHMSATCLVAIYAFGGIERDCIRASLEANTSLHMIIPLFEMIYERGNWELWLCDENGNFVEYYYSRSGVRRGCVLGAFLFCLTMYPVYVMLRGSSWPGWCVVCLLRQRLPCVGPRPHCYCPLSRTVHISKGGTPH
jgi:hypothetical protein